MTATIAGRAFNTNAGISILSVIALSLLAQSASAQVFINEIHYDNAGTDVGEAIEVAGPAGTSLAGWSLVLYNGNGGAAYNTIALAGVLPDQDNGFGTQVTNLPTNGLQNGAPDGIALVNGGGVVEFLSYEGSFMATDGVAVGMTSTDIGVSESSGTAIGFSLQLTGTGSESGDFGWAAEQADTFGSVNTGQMFAAGGGGITTFINEIHYDNVGSDVGEAIEIAGPAGTNLAGWSLVLYNGNGGAPYNTINLAGLLPDQDNGFGTQVTNLPSNGLQNGSPDGIALVNGGSVVQFLSYEGSIMATSGPAAGMTSTDIGVSESSGTPIGDSLQLTGTGSTADDFTWAAPQANTFGDVNTDQFFVGGSGGPPIIINEVDADTIGSDALEFVELYDGGSGNTALDDLVVVFFNGNGDASYNAFDLDGFSTDGDGYFTLGNPGVSPAPDIIFGGNGLQNGADAVAVYMADAADFPNGTAVTVTNLVDALVYDTNDPDDAGLLVLLNAGQAQINEGASNSALHSNQRCPNGSAGARNTVSYAQFAPTPGAENVCTAPAPELLISQVQGSGLASPEVGNTVVIEGIVVGDFQDGAAGVHGDLNGFFIQEEDADADADPGTSEGIFVFDGSSPAVDVMMGDLVRVEGAISEFSGLTEITSFAGVSITSSGNPLPTAASISLPVASVDDFEAYEGMAVNFPQALVISEYFNFDRFNEVMLTSRRHTTPTAEFEPGPDAIMAQQQYLLDRITLDDGRTASNPDPAIHPNGLEFDLTNLFRGGDTVQGVTGVLSEAFGLYRIQPTQGANHSADNPRTAQPDPVGGSLQVASFNVLNYFSTLDDGVNDICGPAMNFECRGADNAEEFMRQRDKIIAALTDIDADVVGLIEIENNFNDDALIDLVDGLNAVNGAGTYDYVASGPVGTDAIKVAFLFQPASVSLLGAHAILDSSVDPRFNDTRNRPALAQSFMDNSSGGVVTVAVNHFKSKGSSCADIGDPDTGDGSGNCNLTRTSAAEALVDWLALDPTGSGSDNVLIIGDLNAYDRETPIDAIRNGGYTDLVDAFLGDGAYSFVFDGRTGYLDHALANASLDPHVTGVSIWHINADEPDLIDYDTSFKGPNQDAIYAPDAYRSSDHDPVIVGLDVPPAVPAPSDVRGRAKSNLVNLVWTDVGADSYEVFRSNTEGGPYEMVGTTSNNVFVDGTVVTGNTYYYVVQSVLGGVNSPNSNEAEVEVANRRRR